MKTLLHFQENNYKNLRKSWDYLAGVVQGVIEAYNKMKLPALTNEELHNLFSNTQEVLLNKMTDGKGFKLNGLPLNGLKAMDIVEKPNGYSEFLSVLESAKETLNKGIGVGDDRAVVHFSSMTHAFQLDTNGTVTLCSKLDDQCKHRFSSYATTEKAKTVFEFLKGVQELYERLNMGKIVNASAFPEFIESTFHQSSEFHPYNKLRINHKGIQKYNQDI